MDKFFKKSTKNWEIFITFKLFFFTVFFLVAPEGGGREDDIPYQIWSWVALIITICYRPVQYLSPKYIQCIGTVYSNEELDSLYNQISLQTLRNCFPHLSFQV